MIRFVAVIACLLCCMAGAPAHAGSCAGLGDGTLHTAQFAAGNGAAPPAAGWQPVTLPDSWSTRHPGLDGFAWYRICFRLDAMPVEPLALYVPHVSLAATFRLNGSLLTPDVVFDRPDGTMGSPMADAPLYLVLPSALFHTGENVLEIRVQGSRRFRSGLSAPQLAPISVLKPRWRTRYTIQVALPYVMFVIMGGALCFLAAHLLHRGRTHLIHLGMVMGVVAIALYFAVDMPITRGTQVVLRITITTVMYWTLVVIGYRMSGARIRGFLPAWHALTLLTLAAIAACATATDVGDRLWMWTWPHVLARLFVVWLLLRRAWRERCVKLAALALSAGFWTATIVQSYLILMNLLPWDSFRLSVAGAIPFCVMLLYVFAAQFVLERDQAAAAQHSAITAERSRILQEMHDGMGAHLITALHLARRNDVKRDVLVRSIEESLQDLRLIIDSLDLGGDDLLPLLANLRFRLEPRLHALGIHLAWDVAAPLPRLSGLTPESALAILRIVQESINNVLQHAGARTIWLVARTVKHAVCIEVRDDGHGFDPACTRGGAHGLPGMRLRARRLGARLDIVSGPTGTTIRLTLPQR